MKHALIDLLSGADSVLELFRVLAALTVIVGLALAIASFITGKSFDLVAFGTGIGLLLGAAGLAIRAKEGATPTEPKP